MEYTCPHCGAPVGAYATKCEYCGNSIPNNVSEIVNNSIKIGNNTTVTNSIIGNSSIIGNNNKVIIDSDWYDEDNWLDRACSGVIWLVAVGVLMFTFYVIGLTLLL